MPELELWLNRNLVNYEKKYSTLSERDKSLIVDWLYSSHHPANLPKISVPQALEKARRWQHREEYQKLIKEDVKSLEVVFKNNPRFHWVKLNSEQNYIREGALMQHCVAEYFKSKHTYIFSLRDDKNVPYATIEIDPACNQIFQIKGSTNGVIKKDFHKLVKDFIDYQITYNHCLFTDTINSHLDVGNFEHLVYQQQLINSEEFKKHTKLKDQKIIVNNLSLNTFPREVECELLYIKNVKTLKELNLKLKVGTLVIAQCLDLEKLEIEGTVSQIIIDNCPRLKNMPSFLKVNKIIINRCPKLKQIAKVLEADECLVIKSFMTSIANECSINKLSLFNVKIQSFADVFKVNRFVFSHLFPLNGHHFKVPVAPLFSQVGTLASLNYWDTVSFYCYQYNFIDESNCLKFAQENADKFIKDFEANNLNRLDELSLVFSYPLGFKDLYFKLVDYFKHKFMN